MPALPFSPQRFIRSLCALLLCLAAATQAQVPRTLNYQGYLTTPTGAAVDNPSLSITVKLYLAASGGTAVFSETQTVAVSNGVFNMLIGAIAPLGLAFDRPYHLGITVGTDAEMSPRQPLTAAPYAMRAALSDSVGNSAAGNVITVVDNAAGAGYDNSITIGADGFPVISYHQAPAGVLRVAKCINTACTGSSIITTIDSTGAVGRGSSITIGADDLPVISYYDLTNQQLKVAKCVNAACTGSSTLSTIGAGYASANGNTPAATSITVASDGLPVISYRASSAGTNNGAVAKCADAACSSASIAPYSFASPINAISIGGDGLPVLTASGDANSPGNVARVFKCVSADCTGPTAGPILNLTTVNSLTGIDGFPTGVGTVASIPPDVRVFKCSDAACTATPTITSVFDMTVPPTGPGLFTGVRQQVLGYAIGADGAPVMSFRNYGDGRLYVARCASASCASLASSAVVVDTATSILSYQSMTIGTDGNPVISYAEYDPLTGGSAKLKVLKCGTPACATVRRR